MCSSDWSSDVCSSDLDDEQTDERSRPAASVGEFAKLSGALPNAIHEVGGGLVGGGGGKGSKHRIKRVFVTHPKTSCGLHVSYTRSPAQSLKLLFLRECPPPYVIETGLSESGRTRDEWEPTRDRKSKRLNSSH